MRGFHHSQETLKSMSLARRLQRAARRQADHLQRAWRAIGRPSTCDAVCSAGPLHEQETRERELLVDGIAVNAPVCAPGSAATTLTDRSVLPHFTSQAAGFAGLISPRGFQIQLNSVSRRLATTTLLRGCRSQSRRSKTLTQRVESQRCCIADFSGKEPASIFQF